MSSKLPIQALDLTAGREVVGLADVVVVDCKGLVFVNPGVVELLDEDFVFPTL